MKYPAIYQSTVNGNVILLLTDKQGVVLGKFETIIGTSGEWNEAAFKNITAEYLANTYGEVKSKAHAEFIVELAEVNNILTEGRKPSKANWFSFRYISGNLTLTLLSSKSSIAIDSSRKQITIPLPPECESVDEWPKIGDDVRYKDAPWEVAALYKHVALLTHDDAMFETTNISELKKPKTPEEELRDEVISYFRDIGQSGIVLIGRYDEVVDDFMSKCNITKKGKGDEF